MNLNIDKAGRLVIPKSMRQQLGITPDTPLELVPQAQGLLLRRIDVRPAMHQVDGLWVHQGTAKPDARWDDVVDGLRTERADAHWPA